MPDSDHHWFTDEYLEAAETFKKASEQVVLYEKVAHTSEWARDQLEIWRKIREANRWTEPGR